MEGNCRNNDQYLPSGDWISVKGRLQAHEYEGRDGMMRSAYDIIAEHVSILQ